MSRPIPFPRKSRGKIAGATRCITPKLRLSLYLTAAVVMLQPVGAQADFASFTDLDITGNVTLVSGFPQVVGSPTVSGSFSKTVGGSTDSSFFDHTGVTSGPNPQAGALTHIGDGFGIVANASGSLGSEVDLAFDLTLNLANSSAQSHEITVILDFFNSVDSSGADAFAESQFTLDDPVEFFFTDLTSDTFFGDEKNGVDLGTFGELVSDSGTPSWDIVLGPSASLLITGAYDLSAGAFASDFSSNFRAELTVIPEPSTILLLSLGGFSLLRKKRRIK